MNDKLLSFPSPRQVDVADRRRANCKLIAVKTISGSEALVHAASRRAIWRRACMAVARNWRPRISQSAIDEIFIFFQTLATAAPQVKTTTE
jgi:hypothetical protein